MRQRSLKPGVPCPPRCRFEEAVSEGVGGYGTVVLFVKEIVDAEETFDACAFEGAAKAEAQVRGGEGVVGVV